MSNLKDRTIFLSERLKLFEAERKTGSRQAAILKIAKEQVAINFPDGFVNPRYLEDWISYLSHIYNNDFEGAQFAAGMVRDSNYTERCRHQSEERFSPNEIAFIHKELLRVWSISDPLLRIEESEKFHSLSFEKGVKDGCISGRDYYIYDHLYQYCK